MCIFCEIIKGNIPSKKVYEDDDVLAILDISQTTYGHTLVMPKEHYENINECPKEVLYKVISITQDLNKQIMNNLKAKGSNILTNTNEASGQSVPHLHFHIIPRYDETDTIKIEVTNNEFNLDEVLNKIQAK